MAQNQLQPLAIKAPAHLGRSEKAEFLRLSEAISTAKGHIPIGFEDVLADYVQARTRIADLTKMRREQIREKTTYYSDKARVMALGREINSAVALSLKLADRLGIGNADA